MQTRIGSIWKTGAPCVKIDGTWHDVNAAWINVNGTWRIYRFPLLGLNIKLTLEEIQATDPNGNPFTRHSAIRSGYGPAVGGKPNDKFDYGTVEKTRYIVDGTSQELRGFETGSDWVSTRKPWKWVSLQWFGKVDINKLAKVIRFDGRLAINYDSNYDPGSDITFMTYELVEEYQFPIDVPLTITF